MCIVFDELDDSEDYEETMLRYRPDLYIEVFEPNFNEGDEQYGFRFIKEIKLLDRTGNKPYLNLTPYNVSK